MKAKVIIIGSIAVIGSAIVWLLYNRSKNSVAPESATPSTFVGDSESGVNPKIKQVVKSGYAAPEFPLKNGSKGNNVTILQNYLNANLKPPMTAMKVDGIFGTNTELALKNVMGKTSIDKETFNKLFT